MEKTPKPLIEISANSTITNTVYQFPSDRMVFSTIESEDESDKSIIVEPCKISLVEHDLHLLFNDNKICFFSYGDENRVNEALVYFLKYKSYMNYNLYTFPSRDSTDTLNKAPEVCEVPFHLDKIVKKEFDDGKTKGYYHDTEPCVLTVEKQSIEEFLLVMNRSLCYAICYYLIGCENVRYFLIEYYKCIEVIANHFENQTELREKCEPHGFVFSDYKKLKRDANDQRNPLNIGRHAPNRDAELINIEVKHLFDQPKSKELFEECSMTCRNMIEMFIQYLKSCQSK